MAQINLDTAGKMLNIVESRRQHRANIIVALNGLAITLIVAIWVFFLKGFVDYSSLNFSTNSPSSNDMIINQGFAFSYVVLAAGISSTVLALWRWYVKDLDYGISRIYPEIAMFELNLGIPSNTGIINELSANAKIKNAMEKLFKEEKIELIKKLVDIKRIGRRGHLTFEIGVFVLIGAFIIIAGINVYNLNRIDKLPQLIDIESNPILALSWIGNILILVGLVIQFFTFRFYQRNPTKEDIKNITERK